MLALNFPFLHVAWKVLICCEYEFFVFSHFLLKVVLKYDTVMLSSSLNCSLIENVTSLLLTTSIINESKGKLEASIDFPLVMQIDVTIFGNRGKLHSEGVEDFVGSKLLVGSKVGTALCTAVGDLVGSVEYGLEEGKNDGLLN